MVMMGPFVSNDLFRHMFKSQKRKLTHDVVCGVDANVEWNENTVCFISHGDTNNMCFVISCGCAALSGIFFPDVEQIDEQCFQFGIHRQRLVPYDPFFLGTLLRCHRRRWAPHHSYHLWSYSLPLVVGPNKSVSLHICLTDILEAPFGAMPSLLWCEFGDSWTARSNSALSVTL